MSKMGILIPINVGNHGSYFAFALEMIDVVLKKRTCGASVVNFGESYTHFRNQCQHYGGEKKDF
jgi:hypothetical protein